MLLCHHTSGMGGCRLRLLLCFVGTAGLFFCCLPCGDATSALASLRLLSVLQGLGGLCSPQFRASSSWLPDTLRKWTPFVFVTFRRCTVAYTSITSFESSHEAGRTALPTFPCEHQQSANPYVAMVVISCEAVSLCVCLEGWQLRWRLAGRTKPVSAS